MRYGRMSLTLAGLLAVGVLTLGSCASDTPEAQGNLDGAELETYLRTNIATHGTVVIDAMDRVFQTVSGNPQSGVNIVPSATGGSGSVGMDFDGDGSNETTANGTLTFNNPQLGIAGGATIALTSINSPRVSGSGMASVTPTGATSVFLGAGAGATPSSTFSSGTTTTEIYDVSMGVDFGSGSPIMGASSLLLATELSGLIHFHVLRGEAKIDADAAFEPDGSGGFRLTVVDEQAGIFFTIP